MLRIAPVMFVAAAIFLAGTVRAVPRDRGKPAPGRERTPHALPRCTGPKRVQCLITVRLIQQLESSDAGVREGAAHTLEQRGPRARFALPALEQTLRHDQTAAVRLAAARAIAAVGASPGTSVPVLLGALADPEPQIRLMVCGLLKQMGPAARPTQDAMRKAALSDGSEDVRICAIQSLLAMGATGKPTIATLEKALLDDPSSAVKTSAMIALERQNRSIKATLPVLEKALCRKDPRLREAASRFLIKLGGRVVPVLSRALKHTSSDCRETAARALGRLSPFPFSALASLRLALADSDGRVRAAAAEGLGLVGPRASSVIPHLRELLLKDKEPLVRAAAAVALGRMGKRGGGVWEALKKGTLDDSPEVRAAASTAMDQVHYY